MALTVNNEIINGYLPILIFLGIGVVLSIVILLIPFLVNKRIHSVSLENYSSHVFLVKKGIHSVFLENYFSHVFIVNKGIHLVFFETTSPMFFNKESTG